ncbi:uncharacterized protein LOC143462204 [Clavelina lepadiformis]|uniref:uncharacterized protein LOC143462204 n=1 Tax=Clavelina lepadiformis TaxID=159417 RepID=UPI00404162C1
MGNRFSKLSDEALWTKELDLADELRKSCDEKGKETDLEKSADILHQLGLLYAQSSPDKISLIRSATLLNAAIVRNPGKKLFLKDLSKLCLQVLEVVSRDIKRKMSEVDLLGVASLVAKKLQTMRDETKKKLSKLHIIPSNVATKEKLINLENEKIADVRDIQQWITAEYTQIMKHISLKVVEIMGKSPCEYAIAGMGSLARSEITPYSDFEHIILLEEGIKGQPGHEDKLNYFRWFSVIFQIIIVNLQETIVPSVAIPSLNDFMKPGGDWFFDTQTTRGVSFDGLMPYACKLPLGRFQKTKAKPWKTELIKEVSEMSKYLDSEEDIKNGYHLCDILMRTCYVCGNEKIFNEFSRQVKAKVEEKKESNHTQFLRQLDEDLGNFDAFDSLTALQTSSKCNIKQVLYRSTSLFISALGRFYSVDEGSSFVIIERLLESGIIDQDLAHRLSYAVAIACEVRLKIYMSKGGQDDYVIQNEVYDMFFNNITKQLAKNIGEKSMVDYFMIADSLQRALRSDNKLMKTHFEVTPQPERTFQLLDLLGFYEQCISEWEIFQKLENPPSLSFSDDLWIRHRVARACYVKRHFQKSFDMYDWLDQQTIVENILKGDVKVHKIWCMFYLNRYEDAVKYAEDEQITLEELNLTADIKFDQLSELIFVHAKSKQKLKRYENVCDIYREALKYLSHPDLRVKDVRKAECHLGIGNCLFELGRYSEAKRKANEALQRFSHHQSGYTRDVENECNILLAKCCAKSSE